MKKLIIAAAVLAAPAAIVAQPLAPLPATPTASIDGATIGGGAGDFRGIDVNPNTGNVILADDDGNAVHVLDTDLNLVSTIANADTTTGGAIDPYQVKVSDDGQIYTNNFAGEVARLGDESVTDAANPTPVIAAVGTSRGFTVEGDYSAGTVVVAIGTGTDVLIYEQDAASSDSFTLAQTVDVSAATANEVESIFFNGDLSELYVWNNGGNIFRYTGGIGSFGSPTDLGVGGFRAGADYDAADDYAAATLDSGSSSALFAEAFTGLSTGTPTATGFQTYTQVGNNNSGAAAIDAPNDVVYICGGDVAYKLEAPSSVSDWSQHTY